MFDMASDRKFRCSQCGMMFQSEESVMKHKNRFCLGVKDSGINREPVDSDDDQFSKVSSNRKTARRSNAKFENSNRQIIDNVENQIFNDKQFDLLEKQDRTYRQILLQYELLEQQQINLIKEMFNLSSKETTTNVAERLKHRLDDLQRRNRVLEQERQIIQEKLEDLISNNYQPVSFYNHDPRRFLHQLKEQQQLNEKAVSFLQQRLVYPYNTLMDPDGIPPYPPNPVGKVSSDTVRDFRNTYLKSGGHDSTVLAQYTDIEYRLRAYEQYPWTTDPPEPLKPIRHPTEKQFDPIDEPVKLSDDENLRFQMELEDIQEKFDQLDQRTRQIEQALASNPLARSLDTQSLKTDFYPMSHVSAEIEIPERDVSTARNRTAADTRLTPRESPPMTVRTSHSLRDPFAPHSYNPTSGFVIFFDLFIRLPRNVQTCRLVTALHHPKSGLGDPSYLDATRTQPYVEERTGEQMNIGIVAMKQPVPRCPPQQALTVVVEIQTSPQKNATAKEDFKTEGWSKFALFDQRNRLLSGRWKIPLKALPVLQNESLATISRLPTFDAVELYYRLVNGQDADEQSNITVSPTIRDLYNLPAHYRK